MMQVDSACATVPSVVAQFAASLPAFPDGRINFTDSPSAPVLNVFILYAERILLVHRSDKVGWLKNHWHVVAGFLDAPVPLKDKVLEEMREELSIDERHVASISLLGIRDVTDKNKHWIVHGVLVHLHDLPDIILDWENQEYAWVDRTTIASYDLLPEISVVVKKLLGLHPNE